MKKNFSLIFAIILCLSMCACGSEKSDQPTIADNAVYNADRMDFEEPLLLVNDSAIRVEVTNFFQEVSPGSGTTEKDKYITLKIENKTDRNMLVVLEQLSIDSNGANVYNGSPVAEISPKSDVVQYYRIRISKSTPLNDMVDLFQLKGRLSVYWDNANGNREKLNHSDFYIAEAFSRDPNTATAETVSQELSLGETAKTDMAEFTLTDFEILQELKVNPYNIQIREGKGTIHTPDKGMVYAAPVFTLRNIAKESYGIEKALNFAVDYNDGYLYEMDDYTCYITHKEGTWERNKIGTSRGQRPELPPLMGGTYQVFLPAIDLIETDTEAPLRIVVRLPASNGTQVFTYLVR